MVLCDIIKNNNPKEESYDVVVEFYLIDKAILKAEKEIFHNLLANLNYSYETPTKVVEQMQLDCLNKTLLKLWKVVHIMATIPATSCFAERSFSCLQRLKTYLRFMMSSNRLSSLAIINIERQLCNKVDINLAINRFANQHG